MAHEKNHDYHILNPSTWPLLTGVAVFVMLFGAVLWMDSSSNPYLFLMDHWCKATGCDLSDHPRLMAHHAAMRARPAVQRILAFYERLETSRII